MPAVLQLRKNRERTADAKRLLESEKLEAMGRVVGGVAHDFNNLLTGILLYCDLLIAGLGSDHPLLAYAQEIRRAGGHSSELIQQLLAVARPPLDDASLLSWNEVIADTRNLLSRLIGEHIELVTDLALTARVVRLDPARMRQILFNLLLNARDAMPQGGRITLATRHRAGGRSGSAPEGTASRDWVELTVADNGCGMDAETRSHLFEHFFTTKAPGRGSGLGLATVGRIVQEENGTIEVESDRGAGTRVIVCLPSAHRNLTPTPGTPNRARETDLISRRGNQP
jgi:two-component system, cell cycle sensor histidine kinase and response regulator CckA